MGLCGLSVVCSFKGHHCQETPNSGENKARETRNSNNFSVAYILQPGPSQPLSPGELGTSTRRQWVSASLSEGY